MKSLEVITPILTTTGKTQQTKNQGLFLDHQRMRSQSKPCLQNLERQVNTEKSHGDMLAWNKGEIKFLAFLS